MADDLAMQISTEKNARLVEQYHLLNIAKAITTFYLSAGYCALLLSRDGRGH
jgi:hypothetical protein